MHINDLKIPAVCLLLFLTITAGAWTGAPTPLDDGHLAVAWSSSLRSTTGEAPETVHDTHAIASDSVAVVPLDGLTAALSIRHAGTYDVWVRIGQSGPSSIPIKAMLSRQGDTLLETVLNADRGDVRQGGPEGYAAYAVQARETDPDGRRREGIGEFGIAVGDTLAADLGDDLMAELGGEEVRASRWINVTRLEAVNSARPLYWWRVGRAELTPGAHQLVLRPEVESMPAGHSIRVDTVMLTTYAHLQYPYRGDIDAPRGSYVRFRLEGPFNQGQGLSIRGNVMHHRHPSYSSSAVFDPLGLDPVDESGPFREAGYTRWYRLNDIKDVPGIGSHHISLTLSVSGSAGRAGATQFAVYPHGDFVLREIPWDEPDGMQISMLLDFERYPDRLRTFRDHARDNYHLALRATGERVFPLTRGPLHFGNGWGAAGGSAREYMVKTLRLLGMNATSTGDALDNQRRYEWHGAAGHYWPPSWLPFDPESTAARYDAHYRAFFEGKSEQYERVAVFQIADEPGEIQRDIMSAPLWRYRASEEGDGIWRDLAGSGELRTRRTDYKDMVLEGKVSLQGDVIGFRAAVPDFDSMQRQVYWRIGSINRNTPDINVSAGRDTQDGQPMTRPGASIGNAATAFKIVHHGDRVALFINDRLIHQHQGTSETGGFSIFGNAKAVHALRVRPLRQDERLHPGQPTSTALDPRIRAASDVDSMLDIDALMLDLDEQDAAADAPPREPLGLHDEVVENWNIAGGNPEAHAGFRRWLQSQGMQPDYFGAEQWDDVRMLTLQSAVETPDDRRLYYWSRRYSGMLTPLMFRQAADAIHRHAPNPDMRGFVALSGHALYFPSQMPLDMFALAEGGQHLLPGVSDWMSQGGWRWDSHQAVAFSVAPYNSGGRVIGSRERLSFPMMHCVWPSTFRGYTMLANQVKHISYWTYGPSYAVTEGYWSDGFGHHQAVHTINNRAAQVDRILADGQMRASRVAMLYSRATEYWHAQSSFADKRAAFLVMSHIGYQPELVTEEQVLEGALAEYDALVVLEPWVRPDASERIMTWALDGGLLITAANAMTMDAYNEPADVLRSRFGLAREFRTGDAPVPEGDARRISAAEGTSPFQAHAVHAPSRVADVTWPDSQIFGRYGDAVPGWLEAPAGRGRVVYIGHRPGLTATAQAVRLGGQEVIWSDTGRDPLVRPLLEAGVERELIVSEPIIMAAPLSNDDGTVIVLYNMRPASFESVDVALREPRAPHSVQRFEGSDLVDLEHTYSDGKVHMRLPLGWGQGQMIVVHREAPTPEDRVSQLREHARQLLASSDWTDQSAALWYMGFFPEWDATDTLQAHLEDERWEIRRVAAEGLGRLKQAASGDALVAALGSETDVHAKVEMLQALAAIGDERILALSIEQGSDGHPMAQLAALRGLAAGLQNSGRSRATDSEAIREMARRGIVSSDPRIRAAALDLIGDLDSGSHIFLAGVFDDDFDVRVRIATADGDKDAMLGRLLEFIARYASGSQAPVVAAIADNDDLRSAFINRADEMPVALLLAIAQRRSDAEVAGALARRLDEVTDNAALRQAAMRQRDPVLTTELFARAGTAPYEMGGNMAMILEHTFDARLGNSLADWRAWLDKQ